MGTGDRRACHPDPVRHTPEYVLTDVDEVRRIVRENPWATIVSPASTGLVASHYPVLLEEGTEGAAGITLLSHVGRPDEVLHELGRHEVLVIVQGPHGYVSPSWYPAGAVVPTWNHVTAHLYGMPELLPDAENFHVLTELVDRFEARVPHPRALAQDEERARRVARGTVGVRVRVTRFEARAKLSQDKAPEVVGRIIEHLEGGGVYADPALAAEMRRVHG